MYPCQLLRVRVWRGAAYSNSSTGTVTTPPVFLQHLATRRGAIAPSPYTCAITALKSGPQGVLEMVGFQF